MKNQAKKLLAKAFAKMFWCASTAFLISACNTSDDVLGEDYIPKEKDLAEALNSVCTDWGITMKETTIRSEGYHAEELNMEEGILRCKSTKKPITIAYQYSGDKLCAAAIITKKKKDTEKLQLESYGFDHVVESDGNSIYSNGYKNIFAVAYETSEGEDNYQIIGFTPLLPTTEYISGHKCTDLGLSVKWATCNVGANNPEEYGGYFAWGEKEEKSSYSWKTYDYCSGSSSTCEDIGKDISGTQYDAAREIMGSYWTIPTKEEMDELRTKCDWVWTSENGVSGYKVFGGTGNYIFLPTAGYKTTSLKYGGTNGYYMTATQYKTADAAHDLEFTNSKRTLSYSMRSCGVSIRAITK